MELQTILFWASCLVAGLYVCKFLFQTPRASSRKHLLPPGSMGWPLLGQTLQYLQRSPVYTLEPFIKEGRTRYGNVFRANLFGNQTIVSTDPDVNRFILHKEGKSFRSHWPKSFRQLFGEKAIIVVTGDEHRLLRGLLVKYLGTGKSKLPQLLHHVEFCALETIQRWRHNSVVRFLEEAKSFSFAVLCKIFTRLSQSEAHRAHELFKAYEDAIFSIPINFPGTNYRRGLQARAKLIDMIQNMVDSRKRQLLNSHNDLLDFLLDQGKSLSNESIHDLFITIFFGGHDTTAKVMTSIVKFLKDSPKSLQELVREHDEIRRSKSKDEGLNMDDYMKMSFTQDVINEALRLANVSLGLHRLALEDVQVKGHFIPKGCNVLISQSSGHLDPNAFPKPSSFDPSRWKVLQASSTSQFIPFGGGIRLCPGAELARLEMAVFLHHFLTQYSWETTELDDLLHTPLLIMPKGIPIRLMSR